MRWTRRIIGQVFEALYGPLAPAYDLISQVGFAGEWRRWQALAAAEARQTPIVELGCGTGWVQSHLQRQGRAALGLDLSPAMLAQARRRAPSRLVRATVQRLPLRDGTVGTLLAIFPTAYILAPATWREAERVLAPGGRFVLATHAWLSADDLQRSLLVAGHRLLYGPPRAEVTLPATSLIGRRIQTPSQHGYLALYIGTQPGGTGEPD